MHVPFGYRHTLQGGVEGIAVGARSVVAREQKRG